MGKQIEITLDQLKKFLDQPYHNKFVMLESAVAPLQNALDTKIFTNHSDTKKISTRAELISLIRRKAHKPSRPKKAKKYNNSYLKRKLKYMGESRPHVYENYGFLNGTNITFTGNKVVMKTTPIMQRGFNYLAYHETQRSVLKLAFLRAWQHIIDNMIEALSKEARKT